MLTLYFGGMGAKGKNFYNDVLKRYGYEREAEQLQDLYLGGNRKEAAALVPDELIAGLSLIGDAGFVKDRIAAYRDAGVTVLERAADRAEQAAGPRDDRRLGELTVLSVLSVLTVQPPTTGWSSSEGNAAASMSAAEPGSSSCS